MATDAGRKDGVLLPADVLDAPVPPHGRWQDWSRRYPRHYIAGVQAPYQIIDSRVRKLKQGGSRVEWLFMFKERTSNQNGTVHGGAVFAILDSLANTAGYYNEGRQTATATGSIAYKRPAVASRLYCAMGYPSSPPPPGSSRSNRAAGEDGKNQPHRNEKKKNRVFIAVDLIEKNTGKIVARTKFQLVHWGGFKAKRSKSVTSKL
mmetsp:Transcript_28429/g.39674  ORF Transcript_28429/g.39674 Transcript_28429/m.39674 type:complete len:205 (+) Transcript_28429:62-676(+)